MQVSFCLRAKGVYSFNYAMLPFERKIKVHLQEACIAIPWNLIRIYSNFEADTTRDSAISRGSQSPEKLALVPPLQIAFRRHTERRADSNFTVSRVSDAQWHAYEANATKMPVIVIHCLCARGMGGGKKNPDT